MKRLFCDVFLASAGMTNRCFQNMIDVNSKKLMNKMTVSVSPLDEGATCSNFCASSTAF